MATVRVFISSTQFIAGGQTLQFSFLQALDDAYWDLSVVPRGTNTDIDLLRTSVDSDAAGTRRLHYIVRNNTNNDTFFTRGAIRVPE